MINTFFNPVEAVKDAKVDRSIGYTFVVLVASAVLTVLSVMIATKSFNLWNSVVVLVSVVLVVLLLGLLLMVSLAILNAKHPTYFAAMTAVAYAIAPLAAALLVSSVLIMIPYVGMILAAVLMLIAAVAMGAIQIRAIMELAGADLLLAFVSAWVVMGVGMMLGWSVYAAFSVMSMATGMGAVSGAMLVP